MSTLLVLLSCNANFMGAFSLPVPGHRDTESMTGWVSEPTTRGTFGLLLSCILTLILCLWTSLHLNIPRQGHTAVGRMGNKLAWTLLALILPELIVYIAWRQRASADALRKEVNEDFKVRVRPFILSSLSTYVLVLETG